MFVKVIFIDTIVNSNRANANDEEICRLLS